MPTFGSRPNAFAVSADWMAISASCSADGFRLMAQSENTATWSLKHMRNAPDTREVPGLVLMTCRAGRTVLAVELMDPETRPSALPSTTSMVPK